MMIKVCLVFILTTISASAYLDNIPKPDSVRWQEVFDAKYFKPADIEDLEKTLIKSPGNLRIRNMLIGYYALKTLSSPVYIDSFARHIKWAVINEPLSEIHLYPLFVYEKMTSYPKSCGEVKKHGIML